MNKKYAILGFFVVIILFGFNNVDAIVVSKNYFSNPVLNQSGPFNLDVKMNGSDSSNRKRNFLVNVTQNDNRIHTWKVRFFCDEKIRIQAAEFAGNACGRALGITSDKIKQFPFSTFKNQRDTLDGFSFKVKGYDANGKWLHTEEKVFRMR